MALEVFAGEFAKRSGTGTQAISGFGFTPKAVKITFVEATSPGHVSDCNYSIGFGTSATNRGCLSQTKHGGTDLGGERHSDTSIMILMGNTGTVEEEADLDSMDSDGITLDWTTSTTNLYQFYVEAWGGSDVENVTVYDFGLQEVTGNKAETGIGFQGNFGMFLLDGNVASNSFVNKLLYAHSCALSSSSRWSLSGSLKNKITKTAQGGGSIDADGTFSVKKKPAQYDSEAEFVSWDTDGFTYNTSDAPMDPGRVICLIFDITTIADVAIGTAAKRSGTGTQAIGSIGCDPSMVSFATAGGEAVGTVRTNEYHPTYGVAFDTTELIIGADMRENASDDPVLNSSQYSETKCIAFKTSAESPTIDAEADLDSFDTGGFTLDWTTNDTNLWGFGWIAWEGVPGTTPIGRTWNIRHDMSEFITQQWDIRHDISDFIKRTWNLRHDIAAYVVIPAESRDDDDAIVGSVGVVLFKKEGAFPYTYTQVDSATTHASLGTHDFVVSQDGSVYVIFYLKELSPDQWDMSGEFTAS